MPSDLDLTRFRAVLGEGFDGADVMVVKKQPSIYDMKALKPFMGEEGIAIRQAMLETDFRPYYTTIFPFFHPTEKVNINMLRAANPAVLEEVNRTGITKFILMGVETARAHPLFEYEFSKMNDLLYRDISVGEYEFRVVQHPGQIAQNPALYAEFIRTVKEFSLPRGTPRVRPPRGESYVVAKERSQADAILRRMGDRVALDLETTSLDPYTCEVLTVNVAWKEGNGYAFPWKLYTPDEWAGWFQGKDLIFQNGTYDVKVFAVNGVYLSIAEDTMLMHSLIDETPGGHSLEIMAQRYLDIDKWGDTVNYADMASVDIDTLGRYGARDTDLTLRLANYFAPQTKGARIHQVLHRAQNAITRSELRGVRIDRDKAHIFAEEIERALHDRREYIADTYGLQNANSPKQVAHLLYDELGLPKQKDKGKVSTSSPALEGIKDLHPVIRDIFEYRHLTKAGSTYVRAVIDASNRDGRYHPEFKLASTETGRLSEKLIMLIPRPDSLTDPDLGKQYQIRLRELFIPDEGYVMVGADYSGLEVSMAAYLTGDAQLIADIRNKIDTHSAVAIQAFDLDEPLEPYDTLKQRVSEKYGYHRTIAKAATFTWLYGGGESAISRNIGIDLTLARDVLAGLRTRYPGVADWQERVKLTVERDGNVSTPWGRTRHFLFHSGLSRKVTEGQYREAINSPNQGMSSDINLAAFAELEGRGLETLFPFHDAVYLQCKERDVEKVKREVKHVMEAVLPGVVPFRADVKAGGSWAELG